MKQIEDLQGRILAAMDRIGTGVGALEQAQTPHRKIRMLMNVRLTV